RQGAARFVLRCDRLDRITDAERLTVAPNDPARVGDAEDLAGADAGGIDRREQDVGVGVADIVVAAVAGADQIQALTADVPGHAEAALPVVGVFLRLEAELAKCALPLKAA